MSTLQEDTRKISKSIARIQGRILGFVMAVLGGFTLFTMTAWLVIKGGKNVGLHLQLLENYFPGYSVSWAGSFIGLFYGLLAGWIMGWTIGFVYNKVVKIRHRDK